MNTRQISSVDFGNIQIRHIIHANLDRKFEPMQGVLGTCVEQTYMCPSSLYIKLTFSPLHILFKFLALSNGHQNPKSRNPLSHIQTFGCRGSPRALQTFLVLPLIDILP